MTATNGMTADSCPSEHVVLARTAPRIINEVKGINRVVYDVTSKSPRHHRVGVGGCVRPTISC